MNSTLRCGGGWLAVAMLSALASAQRDDAWGSRPLGDNTLGSPCAAARQTVDLLARRALATGDEERDPVEAAWQLLALSAHGSSMRGGPHKQACTRLVHWLRRFALLPRRTRPEHLMVAVAVARAAIDTSYRPLRERAVRIAEDLIARFRAPGAAAPTPEEGALLLVLSDCLGKPEHRVLRLDAVHQARVAVELVPAGADHLADAVRAELLRRDGATDTPTRWPADLQHRPVHSWFAAYVTRKRPAHVRRRRWAPVATLLDARAADGLWPGPVADQRWQRAAVLLGVVGMSHDEHGFAPRRR